MTEFDFQLTFALPLGAAVDEVIERLGEAGCDDALVGLGRPGRMALAFLRESETPREAVVSALMDVRSAIRDARLIEASPDLVGVTDIADLLAVSRQNVRKLLFESSAPAPVPVHEGRPTIWRLVKVLEWLRHEKGYAVSPDLIELARVTLQANLAVDARDADGAAQRELARLVS